MLASDVAPAYQDQGLQVMVIHTGPDVGYGLGLLETIAGAYPLLFDVDNQVLEVYQQREDEKVLFPLAYLIDRKGIIRHIYQVEGLGNLPPGLTDDIEALLAE